jgi:hypothetical protein
LARSFGQDEPQVEVEARQAPSKAVPLLHWFPSSRPVAQSLWPLGVRVRVTIGSSSLRHRQRTPRGRRPFPVCRGFFRSRRCGTVYRVDHVLDGDTIALHKGSASASFRDTVEVYFHPECYRRVASNKGTASIWIAGTFSTLEPRRTVSTSPAVCCATSFASATLNVIARLAAPALVSGPIRPGTIVLPWESRNALRTTSTASSARASRLAE